MAIRIYAAALETLFRQRVNDFPTATKMQFRFSDGKSRIINEIAGKYTFYKRKIQIPTVKHCSVENR